MNISQKWFVDLCSVYENEKTIMDVLLFYGLASKIKTTYGRKSRALEFTMEVPYGDIVLECHDFIGNLHRNFRKILSDKYLIID